MIVYDAFAQRRSTERRDSPRPAVLVIGELNVDIIAAGLKAAPQLGKEIEATRFEVVLGSASAIFAAGLAKLGHRVAFVSKVGADAFGTLCRERLAALGVDTAWVQPPRAA